MTSLVNRNGTNSVCDEVLVPSPRPEAVFDGSRVVFYSLIWTGGSLNSTRTHQVLLTNFILLEIHGFSP